MSGFNEITKKELNEAKWKIARIIAYVIIIVCFCAIVFFLVSFLLDKVELPKKTSFNFDNYGFEHVADKSDVRWIELLGYDELNGEYVLSTDWRYPDYYVESGKPLNASVDFLEFENGYCSEGSCTWENSTTEISYDDTSYPINFISNDRVMINNKTITIIDRIKIGDLFIIKTDDDKLFIPWDLIDWERSPEVVEEGSSYPIWDVVWIHYQSKLYVK